MRTPLTARGLMVAISGSDIDAPRWYHERMAKLMLGELLVGAGLVSEEQVLAALRAQRGSGMPLGIYMVRAGILTESELISVLSQQLEVAIIDLDAVSLHDDAVKKVPPEYARANLVVP